MRRATIHKYESQFSYTPQAEANVSSVAGLGLGPMYYRPGCVVIQMYLRDARCREKVFNTASLTEAPTPVSCASKTTPRENRWLPVL